MSQSSWTACLNGLASILVTVSVPVPALMLPLPPIRWPAPVSTRRQSSQAGASCVSVRSVRVISVTHACEHSRLGVFETVSMSRLSIDFGAGMLGVPSTHATATVKPCRLHSARAQCTCTVRVASNVATPHDVLQSVRRACQ